MTVEYMGPKEVAVYVTRTYGKKISPRTISNRVALGTMPEPDVMIGDRNGWSRETIDPWAVKLRGQGARNDLYRAASKSGGASA